MAKGTLQIEYEKVVLENLELKAKVESGLIPCVTCDCFNENDKLNKRIKELRDGGYIRHKHNCNMGEYNSFLTGKGCSCGLSQVLE